MQSHFHERIANIVLITKKLCERLSPMDQYVLVLRSIEHVERVMLLEKQGGLQCRLPQETLLIDVAVVMVRRPWCDSVMRPWGDIRSCNARFSSQLVSKFYFGDGLFKWKDALPFVGNRTRDRSFKSLHMDLLMWDLFRAVDFRLKPLAVYEGAHDPIATPLLCVGDPSLGLHVDVVERFEPWQYEQDAPDPTDPRRQFKPRLEMRVDTALGWPLSVSTSTEVAIMNHWLVSDSAASLGSLRLNPLLRTGVHKRGAAVHVDPPAGHPAAPPHGAGHGGGAAGRLPLVDGPDVPEERADDAGDV